MYKPHLAESYQKELLASLQAKGKLAKPMTAADERRQMENNSTATRIFPASWGKEAVLENLMVKANERIEKANGKAKPGMPTAEATGRCISRKTEPSARHQLQARVAELEMEVKAERVRREHIEEELHGLRDTGSRGGN
ncbi:hypothetical protein Agub_g13395 [Astrephomene gubernaculifera]|uniref:Transposase n=1 Tax=Astrephomene gubernaculifera TaxID=47775 RepID=A0AAD3DZR3_9CHLO|nr:hypothetical protein Agub_g13395 [Astrephomene gubernaculifera]